MLHCGIWPVDHTPIYFYLVGISQPLVYCILWKTIKAINNCPKLQITWAYTKERHIGVCHWIYINLHKPCLVGLCCCFRWIPSTNNNNPFQKKKFSKSTSLLSSKSARYGSLVGTTINENSSRTMPFCRTVLHNT